MSTTTSDEISNQLLTHKISQLSFDITQYEAMLRQKTNLVLPLDEELVLLHQLAEFELGRFLLANKGLNGYWTSYAITRGFQKKGLHPLEEWLLYHAPIVKATQERFATFVQTLQKQVRAGIKMASVPCGLMDDLLSLQYGNLENVELIGIDLDDSAIALAQENARKRGLENATFYQKDAWNLDIQDAYDVVASNGLNIYEFDEARVLELYAQFCRALKIGGTLVVSFLTPPPIMSSESTWRNINSENARKQQALLQDIIDVACQAFCTENQTRAQLEAAGFHVVDVIYDSQGIFPTVVAKKRNSCLQ